MNLPAFGDDFFEAANIDKLGKLVDVDSGASRKPLANHLKIRELVKFEIATLKALGLRSRQNGGTQTVLFIKKPIKSDSRKPRICSAAPHGSTGMSSLLSSISYMGFGGLGADLFRVSQKRYRQN